MVNVMLEQNLSFAVTGVKTWISNVEDFFIFWDKCHKNNTVSTLKSINNHYCGVTRSNILGISRVENNPQNRNFYFYIAAETEKKSDVYFETFIVPSSLWAIFKCDGEVKSTLFEAEMYAFKEWLPTSGYEHAFAPELEVYPENGGVEFWLPVVKKD